MAKIKKILAREILDSRGNPTVEVKVSLENGLAAKASVPSGASTGAHEALELRDKNPRRFLGKGVLTALANVNEKIAPKIVGMDPTEQEKIDEIMIELDGTENKSKLGANAILGVSLSCARASALSQGFPLYYYIRQTYHLPLTTYQLPAPMFNVINGGIHSDSGLSVQEFMIIPMKKASFRERLRIGSEIFYSLREILQKKGLTFAVGDEGGFAPKLGTTRRVFDLLSQVVNFTEYSLGADIFFGLDVAASVFYDKAKTIYLFEGRRYKSKEMTKIYYNWFKKYPMILLEDPLDEDDWDGWVELTQKISQVDPKFLIVGDDIFTTNMSRFETGIKKRAANSILIKLNQIGTLTETVKCINIARDNNYKVVISHRSGETSDTFISDLAVAVNAEFIKAGAPNRGERVAKYNRLMEIEEELEEK